MSLFSVEDSFACIRFGYTSQRILVTGATGFIGQRLVRALMANGHQVVILSRNPGRAAQLFDGGVKSIGNMHELPPTYQLDIIINLAGARILGQRWTAKRKKILYQSRIDLTETVVAWIAAAQTKPRLLLSASAIGYYGIQRPGDVQATAENGPSQPIFMSQLCQDWEAAAHKASADGVAVRCMRFGVVLGRQGALPMMALPIRLGMGGKLGSGKQWFSWIHIDDLLRGIAAIASHCLQQPDAQAPIIDAYNFVAPEAVSQLRFSQIAAKILRRPCFVPTPGLPLRWLLGEQADLLLEGQRIVPQRLQAIGFDFLYPDVRSALQNILCKPSPDLAPIQS